MELPEELLRGIYSYGFEKPSAIQQRAIKPTMLGRDLIAQAQSGTVSPLHLSLVGENGNGERNDDYVKHHLSSLNRVTLDVSENLHIILEIGPFGILLLVALLRLDETLNLTRMLLLFNLTGKNSYVCRWYPC
jgi:hypothetical protein